MRKLTMIAMMMVSCGAEVVQDQRTKAELVVRYPEMARCFDALEAELINAKLFKKCLEETSNHTITIEMGDQILEQLETADQPVALHGSY